jgi:hypothetical protein
VRLPSVEPANAYARCILGSYADYSWHVFSALPSLGLAALTGHSFYFTRRAHNHGGPTLTVCGVTNSYFCKIFDEIDREAVRDKLIASGIVGEDAHVVVAGPANTYAHYISTREEYAVQRYEGASTLYGPCSYFRTCPSTLGFSTQK